MIDAGTPSITAWDIGELRSHIGREAYASDRVQAATVCQLLDIVDQRGGKPAEGQSAPLGIHWCLAPPDVRRSGLQEDGHPQFAHTILPPVPEARRMWAGGEIVWHAPIRIGDVVTRRSVVSDVSLKEGRSGVLCFVELRHDYSTERGPAIIERQDIVYKRSRADALTGRPGTLAPAGRAVRTCTFSTDPVQLFRYSALTGNAHRIHYDYPYATGVEGYPGLVVHGPLQATMLMQAAATLAESPPARFVYRAVSPIFCGEKVILFRGRAGAAAAFWTANADGRVGMRADVQWGPA